ncbi:hypothetical protein BGZ74_003083 [Mortierella antarctica]|nr:hypothetical protein BGZ74_003083 [Mortierella antarctica]
MPKVTSFALYDPEVSLYTCLNLDQTADQGAIKKAYYKLALAYHPDKQSPTATDAERDQATARFQRLGFAYAVLGDPERRRVYDQTGDVSEDGMAGFGAQGQAAGGWDAYFRSLWTGIVNESTIKEFERTYRFSDEEKRDVIQAYVTYRGDMDGILSAVPVCSYEDEARFRTMIQSAIDAKVARKYKAFGGPVVDPKAAARRKREAEAEAAEAAKLWSELGLERLKKQPSTKRKHSSTEPDEPPPEPGSERELQLMLMQQSKNRQSAMDALLDKYTPKKARKEPKKNSGSKKGAKVEASGSSSSSSSVGGSMSMNAQQLHQAQRQQQRYVYDEPSEDEFLAIQARIMGRKTMASAATTNNLVHNQHAHHQQQQQQQQHHPQQQQQQHHAQNQHHHLQHAQQHVHSNLVAATAAAMGMNHTVGYHTNAGNHHIHPSALHTNLNNGGHHPGHNSSHNNGTNNNIGHNSAFRTNQQPMISGGGSVGSRRHDGR